MIKAINNNELLLREKIVKLALLQLNKLYKHGGHGSDEFDCAGLVWYVYNNVLGIDIYKDGIGLSTTTMIMTSSYGDLTFYDENDLDKDISNISRGDILLFHRQSIDDFEPKCDNKYPGHCGIYLGNNKFIHAASIPKQVVTSNFEKSKYWTKKLVASKDIISDLRH